MVTWCSTPPEPRRFCAAPPILPAGLAMSLSGWYVASMPSDRRPCSTQSSRNAYESAKLMPCTSSAGTYSEYVTTLPFSIIIAPPPEMRRTTSKP